MQWKPHTSAQVVKYPSGTSINCCHADVLDIRLPHLHESILSYTEARSRSSLKQPKPRDDSSSSDIWLSDSEDTDLAMVGLLALGGDW